MNIETEIRSFISKEQYNQLVQYFKENATLVKEDYQETFYFDCKEDLRIQKNNYFAKVWLKKGKVHDESREEIELQFKVEDFEKAEQLFLALGYDVEIKWFRTRFEFKWDDITVCLDYTKGYGYIIELEKMCTEESKKDALQLLKEKLHSLNVTLTPREVFEAKFSDYKKNWKTLVESDNQ